MGCAATSLTPPNISAASLEVDSVRPMAMVSLPVSSGNGKPLGATATNQAPACKLDKDCKVRPSSYIQEFYFAYEDDSQEKVENHVCHTWESVCVFVLVYFL